MPLSRATVYRAAWVLPVASPPIHDGAVLVDGGGAIAAVGPRAAVDVLQDAEIVDLGEAALLPGLVNVHAHPELAVFRGALENLQFHDWILRLVGARRSALTDADHALSAEWTAVEALAAGITTLAATETSGAAFEALRRMGLRGVVYVEAFGPDSRQAEDSLSQLRTRVESARIRETERVRIGVSPHAPYSVSDRLFMGVTEYACSERLPVAIHAAESAAERDLVTRGGGAFAPGLHARGIETPVRGRTTIELLDRLGVLRARPLLIHCVDVDADDIRRIADHGCTVAHCPIANAKLGHGVAPYPELREAAVCVGLGTDGVGSNNRLDLLEEARFTSLLHRAQRRRPDLLPPEELLRLCTIEGARALGLDDRIGTLEPGKEADLCGVSLAGAHVRPVHDPLAALFHAARGADVVLTVVGGSPLFREGKYDSVDPAALVPRLNEAAGRLRAVIG